MKKYDIVKHYGIVLRNASQNFIKCNEVNAKEMQTILHLPTTCSTNQATYCLFLLANKL